MKVLSFVRNVRTFEMTPYIGSDMYTILMELGGTTERIT